MFRWKMKIKFIKMEKNGKLTMKLGVSRIHLVNDKKSEYFIGN